MDSNPSATAGNRFLLLTGVALSVALVVGCASPPAEQTLDLRESMTIAEFREADDGHAVSVFTVGGPSTFTVMLPERTIVIDLDEVTLSACCAAITLDDDVRAASAKPIDQVDLRFAITDDVDEAQRNVDTVIDVMEPNDTTVAVLRELQDDLVESAAGNAGRLDAADFARSPDDTDGAYTLRSIPIRTGPDDVDPDSTPAALLNVQVGSEGGFWSVLTVPVNTPASTG